MMIRLGSRSRQNIVKSSTVLHSLINTSSSANIIFYNKCNGNSRTYAVKESSGSNSKKKKEEAYSPENYHRIRHSYDALTEVEDLVNLRRDVQNAEEKMDEETFSDANNDAERSFDLIVAKLNDSVQRGEITLNEAKLVQEVSLLGLDELVQLFGEEGSAHLPTHTRSIRVLHETLSGVHSSAEKHNKLKKRITELFENFQEIEKKYVDVLKRDPNMEPSVLEKRLQRDDELNALDKKIPTDLIPDDVTKHVHDEIEHQIAEARNKVREFLEKRRTVSEDQFLIMSDTDRMWQELYSDKTKVREQNESFGDLLVWFFYSCSASKRKGFLKWLMNNGRSDVVNKVHAASIRMKLYTANAHMEMKREIQRDMYMDDKYEISTDDFSKTYEWGVYISYASNDYVRNIMKKYLDYEFTRAHDASEESVSTLLAQRSDPTIVVKRFRETMSEIGKTFSSVDSNNSLFRDDSYFLPATNPYGYDFEERNFEEQTANLQKFASNTPRDLRFGSALSNLLGLDVDSLHRDGSLYPGDDYQTNTDATDFLDITQGRGFMMNDFDKEDEVANTLSSDEPYIKFTENSEAGHFHKYFHQIVLRSSRNTVAKKGGRVESYSCIMLVGTKGYCGIGFGQAPSPNTAEEKAKVNALKNLTSLKVDPRGMVSKRLDGRCRKSNVILTPNKNPGARGHPVLAAMCNYLGLGYVTVKTYGSRNLLNIIPAFYNCLENLTTVEDHSMLLGQMPIHMLDHTTDFRESCRDRHVFGYQWEK